MPLWSVTSGGLLSAGVEAVGFIKVPAQPQVIESCGLRSLGSSKSHGQWQDRKRGERPLLNRGFSPARAVCDQRSQGQGVRDWAEPPGHVGPRAAIEADDVDSITYASLENVLATNSESCLRINWSALPSHPPLPASAQVHTLYPAGAGVQQAGQP
jgi:hypothetical protein